MKRYISMQRCFLRLQRSFHGWRYPVAVLMAAWLSLAPATPAAALDLNPSTYFDYNYTFSLSQTTVYLSQPFTMTVSGHAVCKQDLPVAVTSATISGTVVAVHTVTNAEVVLNPGYSVTFTDFPQVAGGTMDASRTVALAFPAGTPAGTYQVTGNLVAASVRVANAINWAMDSYFPPTQSIGTVTYVASAAPAPPASGGGGGGGYVPPTTTPALPTPPAAPTGTTQIAVMLDSRGVTTAEVQATSGDASANLVLEARTQALDAAGNPLQNISIVESGETLTPPQTQTVVGPVYDMGPDGATFSPPANLTLPYDPDLLPEGTDLSKLALGVWNAETGKFDRIPGCTVDPETGTVTGLVAHFSTFAVVAGTAPADIRMSDIHVSPSQVVPGGDVLVSVQLVNQGDLPGDYQIELLINDIVVDSRTLYLEGGATAAPEFSISRLIEGDYTVDIGGLKTSFTVTKDPVPDTEPAAEPKPGSPSQPGSAPDVTAPEPADSPVATAAPEIPPARNWTWLLGVIGGANVVVLVLIIVFTRRRA